MPLKNHIGKGDPTFYGLGVAVYENMWDDGMQYISEIEDVISDTFSGIKYAQSRTLRNYENDFHITDDYRTSDQLNITEHIKNEHFKKFNSKCHSVLAACLSSYKEKMIIKEDVFLAEGFQLLKYGVDGHFGSHHDTYPGSNRAISVLIYLNDDYEGGEVEFVHLNLKMKPKAGTVILFPPNYPYRHIAHPVTKGTKYSIVTWLHER